VQLGVGERREAGGGRGLLMYERTLGDSHSGRSAAHDASLVTQRRVSGVTRIGEDKTSQTLITSARGAWPKPPLSLRRSSFALGASHGAECGVSRDCNPLSQQHVTAMSADVRLRICAASYVGLSDLDCGECRVCGLVETGFLDISMLLNTKAPDGLERYQISSQNWHSTKRYNVSLYDASSYQVSGSWVACRSREQMNRDYLI
jgi:hypothetical protein